jgi:AcrR family transcriptional regulator
MSLLSHAAADNPRRSAHSHTAILEAAADLAGRLGYANASIEQIAEQAKVGKQTIYRWWPNKAALFIEVYRELVPADLVADDTGSLDRDLEVLLTRLSELYCNTPAGNILSGLIAEAQTVPELADQLRETYVVPRRAIIGSIFARALARREIDALVDSELCKRPDFRRGLVSPLTRRAAARSQVQEALDRCTPARPYARIGAGYRRGRAGNVAGASRGKKIVPCTEAGSRKDETDGDRHAASRFEEHSALLE